MDVTDTTSPDEVPAVDVSPRPPPVRRKRSLPVVLVLVALLGALVFIAVKSLGDASLFFYNADEAVAHKADLGDKRFRLQGTVEEGTVHRSGDSVRFIVSYNDVEVPVRHQGDPPQLFKANIPVVLEGHWQGDTFASDRILVKHTSSYSAAHPERLQPNPGHGGTTIPTNGGQ